MVVACVVALFVVGVLLVVSVMEMIVAGAVCPAVLIDVFVVFVVYVMAVVVYVMCVVV